MNPGASFFLVDELPFPDESASGAPKALVDDAQASGARRKYCAQGEAGFFSQVSWFPAGYTVPPHTHSHSELIMVIDGSLTVLGGGPTLGPADSVVIESGHEYGFTAGSDGVTFTTIRTGASSTTLAQEEQG
jgi:quercetin dioxygenase-like cupin family protein